MILKCPKGHTVTICIHFDLWYCMDCHIAYEDVELTEVIG